MIHPISHKNEKDRLASLHSFSILDSKPEKDFDNITALAADICNVPVSLVSFVDKDRQWFMSNHGTETKETPRQVSFCAHAILQDDIFIVSDARKDDRFKDNPSVTGKSNIVFYAGVPLIDKEGLPIGSLCVIDHKPRTLEKRQINALKTLATQVMNLLYLRKNEQEINSLNMQLIAKNQDLEKFAMVLAHDIKSPLNNIKGALHLLADDINEKVDKKDMEYIDRIVNTTDYLRSFVTNVLLYYKSSSVTKNAIASVDPHALIHKIKEVYTRDGKSDLQLITDLDEITTNIPGLEQILTNLVDNAVKYNDKEFAKIEVHIQAKDQFYHFKVIDNGPGIPHEEVNKIFELFKTTKTARERSFGIGLASVKRLVGELGGTIRVSANLGKGSAFIFDLPILK